MPSDTDSELLRRVTESQECKFEIIKDPSQMSSFSYHFAYFSRYYGLPLLGEYAPAPDAKFPRTVCTIGQIALGCYIWSRIGRLPRLNPTMATPSQNFLRLIPSAAALGMVVLGTREMWRNVRPAHQDPRYIEMKVARLGFKEERSTMTRFQWYWSGPHRLYPRGVVKFWTMVDLLDIRRGHAWRYVEKLDDIEGLSPVMNENLTEAICEGDVEKMDSKVSGWSIVPFGYSAPIKKLRKEQQQDFLEYEFPNDGQSELHRKLNEPLSVEFVSGPGPRCTIQDFCYGKLFHGPGTGLLLSPAPDSRAASTAIAVAQFAVAYKLLSVFWAKWPILRRVSFLEVPLLTAWMHLSGLGVYYAAGITLRSVEVPGYIEMKVARRLL